MVTICIGPVCVPLHLLLPFLVGIMHRRGWFKWFKQEWVTVRFWKSLFSGATQASAERKAKPDIKKADIAVKDAGATKPDTANSTLKSRNAPLPQFTGSTQQHQQQQQNFSTSDRIGTRQQAAPADQYQASS